MTLMTKTKNRRREVATTLPAEIDSENADSVAADAQSTAGTETPVVGPATNKKKKWFKRGEEVTELRGDFSKYQHLLDMKPTEKLFFRSDYFNVDKSFACVLGFFQDDAADTEFSPFWGVNCIPGPHSSLNHQVTVIVLEQVVRMSQKWIDQYTRQTEKLNKLSTGEQTENGTTTSRRKAAKVSSDFQMVVDELASGASYMNVHKRLLIKAPSLEILEESLEKIERLYIDRFNTLKVAPYVGEQRQELSAITKPNEKKRGKGFGFTSDELAGSYSLVTNGLNDDKGGYVGYLVGDMNTSAVLFDPNAYAHHVVICDGRKEPEMNNELVSSMWCSKLSQAAMRANGSTVHLVLDDANLELLGPSFKRLTSRVDLNTGDVNMFEMFGDADDELGVYAASIEKIKLMFEQMYQSDDAEMVSIIRSTLDELLNKFYINRGMWAHNAEHNRASLRVVNIPHEQVPRLQMFVSYLDTAVKSMKASGQSDESGLRALKVLQGEAKSMLTTHGSLFNNFTSSTIDSVRDSRRVVYDLSSLMTRGGGTGMGVAMAQLVNIVGFAVSNLGAGDSLVIHGTELIDARVKTYLTNQLSRLWKRGGRVVYSYNDMDAMISDKGFNKFHTADYTIFGAMDKVNVEDYQKALNQKIPDNLANFITSKTEDFSYLRRGVSNVVFHLDLPLGVNPMRDKERRSRLAEVKAAEDAVRSEQLLTRKLVPGAGMTSAGGASESPLAKREARAMQKKTLTPMKKSTATMQKTQKEARR